MASTAAVIGGGIAGLSAGIALRKAGFGVTLFEQAEEIRPMGAALSIWGNAMAGLDWLGCGNAVRAKAAGVERLALQDVQGRDLFGPVDLSDSDSWLPLRTDLQAILLERLGAGNVRLGVAVGRAQEEGGRVALAARDGTLLGDFDLLIVADGIHSDIATSLLGNPPEYRGYGGVLNLVDAAPQAAGHGEEIWGEGDRFGLFDAGGSGYWFYMATGTEAGIAVLDHSELLRRSQSFPERIREAVAASDPAALITIPIHSRPMPKSFGRGRVICIGDAAHAMEPNQGQGACQGIEDAWALGILAGRLPPDRILSEFDRLRLKRVARIHRDSATMGAIAHGRSSLRRGVSAIFRAVPKRVDAWQIRQRLAPPDYR